MLSQRWYTSGDSLFTESIFTHMGILPTDPGTLLRRCTPCRCLHQLLLTAPHQRVNTCECFEGFASNPYRPLAWSGHPVTEGRGQGVSALIRHTLHHTYLLSSKQPGRAILWPL